MTKENNKNIAQAIGKSLKTSPKKANLVLRSIRGKKAEDALNSLTFSRKRISALSLSSPAKALRFWCAAQR